MILLTGADGYIGSHLKPFLEDKAYDVKSYDGDIRNFVELDLSGIDMVIHLAALTGVRSSFDKQEEYYDTNVNGTRAIFKACDAHDVPIIYASSSNAAEWWTNPYAVTKKITEEIAPSNSLGIRPHTVYPGRPDMLYYQLKHCPQDIKYINGKHFRDFTHIEDFCSALLTLMVNYSIIEDRVVDIGNGHAQRVLDVAKKFNWKGEVRIDPTPKEREVTIANTTLLKSLGWSPKYLTVDNMNIEHKEQSKPSRTVFWVSLIITLVIVELTIML